MKAINNYDELIASIRNHEKTFLLLFKSGSEQSECALRNFKNAANLSSDINMLRANVNEVRDIHEKYHITSAPAILEFEKEHYKNVIKGCQDAEYIKSVIDEAIYTAKAKKEGKSPKRVVVYTSPACTWCNTIKSYLRKHGIRFREIDVSKDANAARELINKTGQQGVPQTDINGQFVTGFDQKKLDQLLEINV